MEITQKDLLDMDAPVYTSSIKKPTAPKSFLDNISTNKASQLVIVVIAVILVLLILVFAFTGNKKSEAPVTPVSAFTNYISTPM